MINRILWHVAACVTALMLFPTSSGAQAPATSFDELRGVLRDGDEMVVTGVDGRRTRGKLVTVTPSSLDLVVETRRFLFLRQSAPQSFSDTAVTTVTRIDSGREGAVIGFAAGFLLTVISFCTGNEDFFSCEDSLVGGPVNGLLFAGIGFLIDKTINATVYRVGTPAVGGATVSLSPLVTRGGTGALLSMRF